MPKRKQMGNASKITCDLFNVYSDKSIFSEIFFYYEPARWSMKVDRTAQPSFKKVSQWSAHPLIVLS